MGRKIDSSLLIKYIKRLEYLKRLKRCHECNLKILQKRENKENLIYTTKNNLNTLDREIYKMTGRIHSIKNIIREELLR